MKRLLLFLLSAPLLMACGGEDVPEVSKTKGKILPDELVCIEAAKGVKTRTTEADQYTEDGERLLTALEIVKQAVVLAGTFYEPEDNGLIHKDAFFYYSERGFADTMRDTISEKPALLMFSEDILTQKGLHLSFLKGSDVLVLGRVKDGHTKNEHDYLTRDTIAYIPNAVLREAEEKIYKAYSDSNYTEVYRLFHEAYKFKPITAKQYQRLKAAGKN